MSLLVDDADADVRHYAVMGLAAVGDGRAWDAVIARLTAMLGRTRTTEYGDDITPVVTSVIYLLRHAGRDEARAAAVVSLLRLRWPRLTDQEQRWLRRHWPAVTPSAGTVSEPAIPDPAALQQWLLDEPLLAQPALV